MASAGGVAQWQSRGIIILWSGVRIPSPLPKIQPRFIRGLIFGTGIWTPAQGSEQQQKGGITTVHRSFNEGGLCKVAKQSLRRIKITLFLIIKETKCFQYKNSNVARCIEFLYKRIRKTTLILEHFDRLFYRLLSSLSKSYGIKK